jgi:hypothetical protein
MYSIIISVFYMGSIYAVPQVIKNLLSDDEREYIMKEVEDKFYISTVSEDYTLDERVRVSESAWLNSDDPIVRNIIDRCLTHTDLPFTNCERIVVVRYKPGGFYLPHQDAYENAKNMRMHTFILALNDDYEGGETSFPNINKEYKLHKGDALFFETLDNHEMITRKALHGGNPVKSGEKWICNLWVRKYPYAPTV